MSRRKNRQKFNQKNETVKTNPKTVVSLDKHADPTNILVNNRDIVYSLLTGAFCIALLLALSEIVNKTNWLNPIIDQFNNLL